MATHHHNTAAAGSAIPSGEHPKTASALGDVNKAKTGLQNAGYSIHQKLHKDPEGPWQEKAGEASDIAAAKKGMHDAMGTEEEYVNSLGNQGSGLGNKVGGGE